MILRDFIEEHNFDNEIDIFNFFINDEIISFVKTLSINSNIKLCSIVLLHDNFEVTIRFKICKSSDKDVITALN